MAQTQVSTTVKTPFSKPYKDIYIVNSNYNQYGHSVLPTHSKSILSNYPSQYSQHSRYSYHARSKESLISSATPTPVNSYAEDDHGDAEDDEENDIVQLNSNYVQHQAGNTVASSSGSIKKSKFSYRSLISPDNKVKRFLNRLDADSFSIFSLKSSSHNFQLATIKDLPLEILKLVLSYVDDYKTLVRCLYVNKQFYKSSKFIVYESPFLTSTYRVAQLITTLRQHPENGELIKDLNLSRLEPGTLQSIEDGHDQPSPLDNDTDSVNTENEDSFPNNLEYAHASWRDWKYRGDPLYGSSMLNSYNLSKSKSSTSVNSLSTVSSIKVRFLKQIKSNAESFNEDFNTKFKNFGSKLVLKFQKSKHVAAKKKNLDHQEPNKLKRKLGDTTINNDQNGLMKTNSIKQVKINFQDPKNQPFVEGHPYTNKFLLKYSSSKDLPIGYVLYFLDLCPNLTKLNLSKISLSTDFKIVYETPQFRIPSLVENVLPFNDDSTNIDGSSEKKLLPLYLSDANVYFNGKTFQNQFIKLYESDIILKLSQLSKLTELNLSSISWLNFKVLRIFRKNSNSLNNQSSNLKTINLSNSGMIRGLNWAFEFNDIEDFKTYFANDVEPELKDERSNIMRNVGMNY